MKTPYQAVVQPIGRSELWVLSHLDGANELDHARSVSEYLIELGVKDYKIIHYAPIVCKMIAIEDINLN